MRDLRWEATQKSAQKLLTAIDGNVRLTKGSGAVKGNGDVISDAFMVECKFRSNKNFVVKIDELIKVTEEADLIGRSAFMYIENKAGQAIVAMEPSVFSHAIHAAFAEGMKHASKQNSSSTSPV
jgi:hypothetical protein